MMFRGVSRPLGIAFLATYGGYVALQYYGLGSIGL
jgi:hypothetical protein